MTNDGLRHATLTFERLFDAPVDRVFTAFADPVARAAWGTPSDTAAFFYEEANFRIGGRDVFRCGDKADPQYRGVTTYLDIVPNERIVSSEIVEHAGTRLLISLSTATFAPAPAGTKLLVTVQATSLAGDDMIRGAEFGHRASLDNLVAAMKE
ncbi:MAG TPA: SRPBCC domain-containing protein [Beijerinckiaceae bacterium]|nr:SRPBCC domain-containing protein [Beijerinckiaceae bacterium]